MVTRVARPDTNKGIAAYEALLKIVPENQTALINLAVQLEGRGENAECGARDSGNAVTRRTTSLARHELRARAATANWRKYLRR